MSAPIPEIVVIASVAVDGYAGARADQSRRRPDRRGLADDGLPGASEPRQRRGEHPATRAPGARGDRLRAQPAGPGHADATLRPGRRGHRPDHQPVLPRAARRTGPGHLRGEPADGAVGVRRAGELDRGGAGYPGRCRRRADLHDGDRRRPRAEASRGAAPADRARQPLHPEAGLRPGHQRQRGGRPTGRGVLPRPRPHGRGRDRRQRPGQHRPRATPGVRERASPSEASRSRPTGLPSATSPTTRPAPSGSTCSAAAAARRRCSASTTWWRSASRTQHTGWAS